MPWGIKAYSDTGTDVLQMAQMFSLDLFWASSTPRSRTYSIPSGSSILAIPMYTHTDQNSDPISVGTNSVSWTYSTFGGDYQILIMLKTV